MILFKSVFKGFFTVRWITANALVAALYAVITYLCGPLSYIGDSLQLRLSEVLTLLVFFSPNYTLGLTLGCLLGNIMSMYGLPDMILGTGATFIACILMIVVRYTAKNLLLSAFMPCFINALIVPVIVFLYNIGTLYQFDFYAYLTIFGRTFLGEFLVIICIGYPIFLSLAKKYKNFYKLINCEQSFAFKF
jgi:uncharacterized membrane protein